MPEPSSVEEFQTQMGAIVDGAKDRSLTDEEVKTYEKLEQDMQAFQKSDEIRKRQKAWSRPRVSIAPPLPAGVESRDSEMYAFDNYLRTGQKNADLTFAQTEGTTTQGGYMVPTVLQNRMVEVLKAYGGLSRVADHITTGAGNPINWPTIDDTANSAVVAAEGSAAGSGGADLVFGQVSLSAYKIAATGASNLGLKVTKELMADATFNVTERVTRMIGIRLARAAASLYIKGTGSSTVSGLLHTSGNANELAVSGGEFQNAADAWAGLLALYHDLDPAYREGAVWLMNDGTAKQIESLVDGSSRPLLVANWQSGFYAPVLAGASEGGQQGPIQTGYSLLGKPVIIDQAVPDYSATSAANPDPGTNDDIYLAFGNFQEAYIIRDVQGISVEADPYTLMGSNEIQYFGFMRTDAKIQNRGAFKTQAGYHV